MMNFWVVGVSPPGRSEKACWDTWHLAQVFEHETTREKCRTTLRLRKWYMQRCGVEKELIEPKRLLSEIVGPECMERVGDGV